ncbi:uncharacterized protein LOC127001880 isoform X32 [Eriocheir sinensis]|uniref:uncharacterized protein LOC127001880 isoform X32 n=1 Tax=Eriocheir sinensis TaxID=95602 RepID=UPI0021C9936F|nr:uncharacterized protein LOC127001880 isoform X32 [Eriocheir sinensis]
MKASLSLLAMLLKTYFPAVGASSSPAPDTRCPASITISGDEEWANITTVQNKSHDWGTVFYMSPDPGFRGVMLVAAGDAWQHDAWFTLDNTCFPRHAQWWRLAARVWRMMNDDTNSDNYLVFIVKIGDCALKCRRGGFRDPMNVNVAAQGPSRWRLGHPEPCTVEGNTTQNPSLINCTTTFTTTTTTTTTPTTTTTTTTTTTIAIIVVPVMIGVAVVVVLLVVVIKCYRQRRGNPDVRMRFQGVPSASESVVVENSLYETVDNTRRTEVVENSLYETLDNTRRTEVVENSLYETVDNTRRTEVVENSLYETLDNTRRTEVVENSLYETVDNTRRTEVVENSLYETLDNTRGTEVVENSLYETLDNTRRTEVVENSLYETVDNTRRTEVVENSLYETVDNTRRTEVVENSLYEPFENVRKPR